jgi:hypothetical protein
MNMHVGKELDEKSVVVLPNTRAKIVTITIGKQDEEGRDLGRQYQFYGPWTGEDARRAMAGFFRSYRMSVREKSRELANNKVERVG